MKITNSIQLNRMNAVSYKGQNNSQASTKVRAIDPNELDDVLVIDSDTYKDAFSKSFAEGDGLGSYLKDVAKEIAALFNPKYNEQAAKNIKAIDAAAGKLVEAEKNYGIEFALLPTNYEDYSINFNGLTKKKINIIT